MDQKQNSGEGQPKNAGRLPGLKPDLLSIYQGMQRIGATGPGSAKNVQAISKELKLGKNKAQHALEELEGKGIVGHLTAGNETSWFTKR